MPELNINEIKQALKGGGARPNLYKIIFPEGDNGIPADISRRASVLCKAAAIPGGELGEIIVDYVGRQIKLPGDRIFNDWSATIYCDRDQLIYKGFQDWNGKFNDFETNQALDDYENLLSSVVTIQQLKKDGTIVGEWELHDVWPATVAEITLDQTSRDTISEFEVTFKYNWFKRNN